MTVSIAPKIAASLQLSEDELYRQALASFLREQKREVLQTRLEILSRYGVSTIAQLEKMITDGVVAEHPAWEDLIVAENLTARLAELNDDLADVREPA